MRTATKKLKPDLELIHFDPNVRTNFTAGILLRAFYVSVYSASILNNGTKNDAGANWPPRRRCCPADFSGFLTKKQKHPLVSQCSCVFDSLTGLMRLMNSNCALISVVCLFFFILCLTLNRL